MKLLLKNQESCIIKGGQTTNYSKLERGTRQGEPLSAYLFILEKKSLSVLWGKNKSKIKHDTLCNDYENVRLKSVDIF